MKWGIVGYGLFAPKFMRSLEDLEGEEIYAIASRSNSDAAKKNVPDTRVYEDYEAFFADDQIDIVYVCTTHNFHHDLTVRALESGKHVVCEKPMGLSETEVQSMIDVSNAQQRFLMEGLWTRYLPAYQKIKSLVNDGIIGELVYLTADFGFNALIKPKQRLIKPELAGGALYDLGVYPISVANDFFGVPIDIKAHAKLIQNGVDERVSISLRYPNALVAHLHANLGAKTSNTAVIYGTKGSIKLELFWMVQNFSVTVNEETEDFHMPYRSSGYYHEIEHAVERIQQGETEPVWFSHQDSLLSARIIDEVFRQIKN